jgi:hypothetical protein
LVHAAIRRQLHQPHAVKRTPDSPAVVVFPPLLFASTLAVGLVLQWIRPAHLLPPLMARVLGLAILILSGLLVRAAEQAMKSGLSSFSR